MKVSKDAVILGSIMAVAAVCFSVIDYGRGMRKTLELLEQDGCTISDANGNVIKPEITFFGKVIK